MIAVIIMALIVSSARIRQEAQGERVLRDLDAIATSSIQYYKANSSWPINLASLMPGYLSLNVSGINPFGNAYVINPQVSGVTVSTLMPCGLITTEGFGSEVVVLNQANNDLVSITKPIESSVWQLEYEKKYIYNN